MEVLWPQGPFILALGSALKCEPGPGHLGMRGLPLATHMFPVTGDEWQFFPASLHVAQGSCSWLFYQHCTFEITLIQGINFMRNVL